MWRYHLFMLLTNLWARTCYRMRVIGRENVPAKGPLIIVANHPGKLLADLMIFPAIYPRRRPYVIIYGFPVRGQARGFAKVMRWGLDVLPVIAADQRGKGTALKATREILQTLDRGEPVFFSPEAEVSWTGRLNPFRPASAWTALRTGAPILPTALVGTYDVWPRWQESLNLYGKVTVRFGKPFTLTDAPPRNITPEMLKEANARIQAEISQLLEMGH